MKVTLRTIAGLLSSAALVSCSNVNDDPDISQSPIEFGTTVSRAAISDKNGLSSFSVWGGYQGVEDLFDGTIVDKNGAYTDGTRYWIPGETFYFYAVHPAVLPQGTTVDVTNVASNGTITVSNFDCSATGADAVDLMTATAKRATNSLIQPDDTKAVPLTFNHELAKVNFVVKSENTVATITSFKVYGISYVGTLTKNIQPQSLTWTSQELSTEGDNRFRLEEEFEFNTTNGWEKDILGDLLLIPHSNLSTAKLKISYKYSGDNKPQTSEIKLNEKTESWLAGQSYKYTLAIERGKLSIYVTVNDWDGKDTSVSWE